MVLVKTLQNFTRGLRLYEKEAPKQEFFPEFCEKFKNTFLTQNTFEQLLLQFLYSTMLRLLTILEKIVFETSAVSLSLSIIFSILASMIFPFGLIRKKKVSPVTKRFVVSNFLFIDVTLFYYMTPFDFCQRLNVFTFEAYSSLSLF